MHRDRPLLNPRTSAVVAKSLLGEQEDRRRICVASMDVALPDEALQIVTTAFGWVLDSASVLRRLEAGAA